MQKQKRKKKQKNKETQQVINPGKHKKIGNLNYYGEEIVKELIDKIISLSLTNIFREKVNSKISDFCFDSIKRALNLTLSITNINHDKDNIYNIENITDDKKRLNSDEKRYKTKNHLRCNKIRYKKIESDMFEYAEINRDFEFEMNLKDKDIDDYLNKSVEINSIISIKKRAKTNFWGIIAQPKSYGPQRLASKSNPLNKNIILNNNKNDKDIIKNHLQKLKENRKIKHKGSFHSNSLRPSFSSARNNESFLKKSSELSLFEKRQRKYLILDMDKMVELKETKIKIEEPEEIKELRKINLEKIKLLKDEEERLKATKKKYSKKNIEVAYDLDSINLTTQERTKNVQIQKKIVEDQIKKGNFAIDFNNKIILVRQVKPESLEADFPIVVAKHKERYNNNNIINDNISNQANDKSKKKIIAEEKNKYPGNVMNFVNFNSYGWKIEPSGSNFEIIKPEVGVTIHEGNEIKSGGNQYFEKYKRFSLEDYSKMLKDMAFQPEIDKNLFFQKKIQEENKKDMDNNKKNNISKEISKLSKGLNPLSQKIKNMKLNTQKNKKYMNKSQSEIFTLDRATLYKNLLVYDENEKNKNKNKNKRGFSHRIKPNILFLKRMNNILNKKNENSFQLIDTFNKNIINNMSNASLISKKKKNNLPIIPLKKNRSDIFSKNENLLRTRIKKSDENSLL